MDAAAGNKSEHNLWSVKTHPKNKQKSKMNAVVSNLIENVYIL